MIRATTEQPRLDTGCHRDLFLGSFQVYDLYVSLQPLHENSGYDVSRSNDLFMAVDVTTQLNRVRGHAAHWVSFSATTKDKFNGFDPEDRRALLECQYRFNLVCPKLVDDYVNEILANDKFLSDLAERRVSPAGLRMPTIPKPEFTPEVFAAELTKMSGNVSAALLFDEARRVRSLEEELKP